MEKQLQVWALDPVLFDKAVKYVKQKLWTTFLSMKKMLKTAYSLVSIMWNALFMYQSIVEDQMPFTKTFENEGTLKKVLLNLFHSDGISNNIVIQ